MARATAWSVLPALALAASGGPVAASAQNAGEPPASRIAIDRWLVAGPLSARGEEPLALDHLRGAESEILPERGREAGSVRWSLLRRDSATEFALEAAGGRPAVGYAHAYLRAPVEGEVRLLVRGPACGEVAARLNGQSLAAAPRRGDTLSVRLGVGWNTLLLKLHAAGCPLEFGATILPGPGGGGGLRAQASRPPGEARSFPAAGVAAPERLAVEMPLVWLGDALLAPVALPLTAWGPSPVDSAEVRARIGPAEVRASTSELLPAQQRRLRVTVPFEALRRGALERPARVEVRWAGSGAESRATIPADELLRAVHGPIRLAGWRGVGEGGVEETLPAGPGEARAGSWSVPAELAGLGLLLDATGAPGAWRVDERELAGAEPIVPLCAPCRRGDTFGLQAASAGAWSGPPAVRVTSGGYPSAAGTPGAPGASAWLEALGRDENRRYLELAERYGGGDAGS